MVIFLLRSCNIFAKTNIDFSLINQMVNAGKLMVNIGHQWPTVNYFYWYFFVFLIRKKSKSPGGSLNPQVNSGEQWVNSQTFNCSPINLLYYLIFIFLVNSVKS